MYLSSRVIYGSWVDSGEAVGFTVGDGEGGSVGGIFMIADGEASGVTEPSGAGERGPHPHRMIKENENNKMKTKIFFIIPP